MAMRRAGTPTRAPSPRAMRVSSAKHTSMPRPSPVYTRMCGWWHGMCGYILMIERPVFLLSHTFVSYTLVISATNQPNQDARNVPPSPSPAASGVTIRPSTSFPPSGEPDAPFVPFRYPSARAARQLRMEDCLLGVLF